MALHATNVTKVLELFENDLFSTSLFSYFASGLSVSGVARL